MSVLMISVVDRKRNFVAKAVLSGAAFVVILSGCVTDPAPHEFQHWGETQGTTYSIKYWGGDSVPQAAFDSILHEVDLAANLWMPESVISSINAWRRTDTVFTFVDRAQVFSVLWSWSEELHQASGGAFDPTVAPLMELWGFGLSKRSKVSAEAVDSCVAHVGWGFSRLDLNEVEEGRHYVASEILKRDSLAGLDFNSIAQGLTVDLLADKIQALNVPHFMVEVGGEVRAQGTNPRGIPWRIAIDKPQDNWEEGRPLEAIVELKNAALCTSGNYRKFYIEDGVRRSHTLDPRTGYPVEHGLLSATIKASTAVLADGLSTSCMVLGPEAGRAFISTYRLDHPEEAIEAMFILDDAGTARHWLTPGWEGTLEFVEGQEP